MAAGARAIWDVKLEARELAEQGLVVLVDRETREPIAGPSGDPDEIDAMLEDVYPCDVALAEEIGADSDTQPAPAVETSGGSMPPAPRNAEPASVSVDSQASRSNHLAGAQQTKRTDVDHISHDSHVNPDNNGEAIALPINRIPEQDDAPIEVDEVKHTDVGNGIWIATRHGADLRYCYPLGCWLAWTGSRWDMGDPGEPIRRAKENARWLAASALEIDDDKRRGRALKWALESEKEARIKAALSMAQSEPGVAIKPEGLDADPWLLNVSNGTIDLRTGDLRPHRRGDLITRQIDTPYDPTAHAPRWQAFLERILAGDHDLIRFLQRAVGYSLTGSTGEQVLLILWGSGANGKSTFLDLLLDLLGEYAQQAPAETFLVRRDSIPNDVARLRGARMVAAAELGEGRRLNEALVKRLTGGDRIAARFLRAEWFEFTPQFTPWLATNHKPEIVGTDLGIWRRIRLVPFTVTIPEDERDPQLGAKLRQESPGILAWAVQGYLDWQQHGLEAPEAVVAATAEYRDEQDTVGAFLDDCCNAGDGQRAKASELHARYAYWAEANGHERLDQKALARRLRERGLSSKRTKVGTWWIGVSLRVTGDA